MRKYLLASKVLPPFELVECPEFFTVKMKSGGDIFEINVPIKQFENYDEYMQYMKEEMESINNAVLMAKATTLVEVKAP